jgi:hypothetical protein
MFQMLGVFAEFERAMIRERVNAGLARARAQGKRLGRPPISKEQAAAIRKAKAGGQGIRAIARGLGLGVATVQSCRPREGAGRPTVLRTLARVSPDIGRQLRMGRASRHSWGQERPSLDRPERSRRRPGLLRWSASSRHGAPDYKTQIMPSRTRQLSRRERHADCWRASLDSPSVEFKNA